MANFPTETVQRHLDPVVVARPMLSCPVFKKGRGLPSADGDLGSLSRRRAGYLIVAGHFGTIANLIPSDVDLKVAPRCPDACWRLKPGRIA